jgi:putative nucleotidyltransferase with HDIG domain
MAYGLSHTVSILLGWTGEDASPDDAPARRSVAARIGAVSGLKTFPRVAQETLSLLSDPEFTVDSVTKAIREDPSLAAGVLRLANSAFFSPATHVLSIDQAFVRLGRGSVEEVLYAVVTMQMFPDVRGYGAKVRDHCAATAAMAYCLAAEVAPRSREEMFLAGLMHDVGKMLFIEAAEFAYPQEETDGPLAPDRTHDLERRALGFDHAQVAGEVLRRWQIPDPVPDIVALHHAPKIATTFPHVRERVSLLRAADAVEHCLAEGGAPECEAFEVLAALPELGAIGMDKTSLAALWTDLESSHKEALRLFGATSSPPPPRS